MRGFTLIELIISLAIFTILLTVAVPNLSWFMDNYKAKQSLQTLQRALNSARTLALNRSQPITLCPMQGTTCHNDWSSPLAIFYDRDQDLILDNTETLLLTVSNEAQEGYWQKKRSQQNYIKFTPQGHAFSSATTFLYCPDSGKHSLAKQLVINFQGRIRNGLYLNSRGTPYASISPLSCP